MQLELRDADERDVLYVVEVEPRERSAQMEYAGNLFAAARRVESTEARAAYWIYRMVV